MYKSLEQKENKKEEETWKDIKGYEGLYQVSNMGRVKSLGRAVPNEPVGFAGLNSLQRTEISPNYN